MVSELPSDMNGKSKTPAATHLNFTPQGKKLSEDKHSYSTT